LNRGGEPDEGYPAVDKFTGNRFEPIQF